VTGTQRPVRPILTVRARIYGRKVPPTRRRSSQRSPSASASLRKRSAELSSYFVKTDQWSKVLSGEIDVIFGSKGAGKSAIYSTLLSRDGDLFDRGITQSPPKTRRAHRRSRILSRTRPRQRQSSSDSGSSTSLADWLSTRRLRGEGIARGRSTGALHAEGLLPAKHTPCARASGLYGLGSPAPAEGREGEVKLDPATRRSGRHRRQDRFGGAVGQRKVDWHAVSGCPLTLANQALQMRASSCGCCLTARCAFAESRELEANGLRALFQVLLGPGVS
jgi:hypothetical protein